MFPLPYVGTKGSTKSSSQGSNFGFKRDFCLRDRYARLKQSNGHLFLRQKSHSLVFRNSRSANFKVRGRVFCPRQEFIF